MSPGIMAKGQRYQLKMQVAGSRFLLRLAEMWSVGVDSRTASTARLSLIHAVPGGPKIF
jgi:hypothetical protein